MNHSKMKRMNFKWFEVLEIFQSIAKSLTLPLLLLLCIQLYCSYPEFAWHVMQENKMKIPMKRECENARNSSLSYLYDIHTTSKHRTIIHSVRERQNLHWEVWRVINKVSNGQIIMFIIRFQSKLQQSRFAAFEQI